ncbi:hypothetical protein GCM10011390_40860 [Aureimonas endophytica]|uniref:YjiS-like domain-containing protein n=1 Tax=Aureimonas endophytica TaxID=2027858 RepID=A0A916ZZ04_9HYPH|nr:hypothetical protein GCM10011390_40860 [Aureimonas endophytica]
MRRRAYRRCGRAPILVLSKRDRTEPGSDRRNPKDKTMGIARTLRNWKTYRNTVDELNRLSQRELADLGLSRADIPAVARRAVR